MSPTKDRAALLPAELERKLAGFRFYRHAPTGGRVLGPHRGTGSGSSLEFARHKEYSPGDDLRRVNWKLFARSDRYYVKEYTRELGAEVLMVVDCSPSMRTPGAPTKLEAASRLCAALSWVMLHQGDKVGLRLEDRGTVPGNLRPDRDPAHFLRVAKILGQGLEGFPEDYPGFPADDGSRERTVLFFSDFLFSTQHFVKRLSELRKGRNRVMLFHVIDPLEYRPALVDGVPDWSQAHADAFPYAEAVRFRCPETGRSILLDGRTMRAEYLQSFRHFMEELRGAAEEYLTEYVPMSTAEDFEAFLFRLLGRARRV
jgi:uncharacterized protein (DUF58 family)